MSSALLSSSLRGTAVPQACVKAQRQTHRARCVSCTASYNHRRNPWYGSEGSDQQRRQQEAFQQAFKAFAGPLSVGISVNEEEVKNVMKSLQEAVQATWGTSYGTADSAGSPSSSTATSTGTSTSPATAPEAGRSGLWFPVDVRESESAYMYIADCPGLSKTDIQVQVDKDRNLVVSGERKFKRPEDVQAWEAHQTERRQGSFSRKFKLPTNADTSKIYAKTVDGVLTITIKKEAPNTDQTSIPVY
jgi:HSP20 family protein